MKVKVVIERGEDGGYIASAPDLRGCWSQGRTSDEAMTNIREAVKAWLEAERGKSGDEPRSDDSE